MIQMLFLFKYTYFLYNIQANLLVRLADYYEFDSHGVPHIFSLLQTFLSLVKDNRQKINFGIKKKSLKNLKK